MTSVKDVMMKEVETCTPDTNLAAAGGKMWSFDCGFLPVVDNDGKVLGVLTDRDICIALASRDQVASQVRVKDVYSGKLFSCNPDDDVKTALKIMYTARVRRLPVINYEGKLAGILSLDDAAIVARDTSAEGSDLTCRDVAFTLKEISGRRDIEILQEKVVRVG